MPILFVLLLYIIGLILTNIDLIPLTICLSIFCIFIILYKIKNRKKPLVFGIILLLLGIIQTNIRLPEINIKNEIGFVTKKTESYAIIKIKGRKYFTYDLDESRLFDVVKVSGKPVDLDFKHVESSFNFEKYLNNQGVYQQLLVKYDKTLIQNPIDHLYYQEKILNNFKSKEGKMIASSLLFGKQEDELRQISNKLMITSLLSTSGFFLTFILYGLSKFLAYFIDQEHSKMFTFIFYLPYMFFNINRFSVLRVGIMFLISLINNHFEINIDPIKKKSLIFLIFLLCNHSLIFSSSYYIPLIISLILEFSYLYLQNENTTITNIKRKFLISVILFPFIFSNNNCFNLLSIIITFTCTFYFKFLFLLAFFSFYGLYLPFYDNIFKFTYNILEKVDLKYLNFNIPKFNSFGYVIYFILLFVFIYFKEINWKTFYKKVFYVQITSFLLYLMPIENQFTVEVSFINVGQGDSTLIRYQNKSYLIDTGGNLNMDLATDCVIPYLRKERIYKLDSVFITHYDFDHYGALDSLKKNFIIDNIYDYNSTFPIKKGPLNFINLNTYWSPSDENENNKSLVLYLDICDKTFLLMGDAPSSIEKEIIKNHSITCDILKVGHHGSKDSSCLEFLKQVDPDVAIISCGKHNKYGHPNDETIQRLNKLKIPYRRTDFESTITYKFNAY